VEAVNKLIKAASAWVKVGGKADVTNAIEDINEDLPRLPPGQVRLPLISVLFCLVDDGLTWSGE